MASHSITLDARDRSAEHVREGEVRARSRAEWLIRTASCDLVVPLASFVVGRGVQADVHIEDDAVSRRHALFRVGRRGQPTIQDLDSRNGTFLNGCRIHSVAVLEANDRVELGSYELQLLRVPGGAVLVEPSTRELARAPRAESGPVEICRDPLEQLSARERELFALVVRGLSQREVAERLGLSVKTVQTHRTRIGQKLGARSRADLIGVALKAGVLKANPANQGFP